MYHKAVHPRPGTADGGGGGHPADHSLSSSLSSTSTSSSMELSNDGGRGSGRGLDDEDDTWTDVETRVSYDKVNRSQDFILPLPSLLLSPAQCAVAVEGRPGSAQPALTHQAITNRK